MADIIRVGVYGLDRLMTTSMRADQFEQDYAKWRHAREANPAQITEDATRNALLGHFLSKDPNQHLATLQMVALIGESGIWRRHETQGHNDFRIDIESRGGNAYQFTFKSSLDQSVGAPLEKSIDEVA